MACLDDPTVLDFIAGVLTPAEVARIDAHMDTCPSCRQVVLSVARADARADETRTAGDSFSRFTLLERLGAGAMGIVYAAYDPQLDRRIALKVLNTSADDPSTRERLLAEAQAMAKLSHPNVVTIYDVGAAGERVFIAMELIDGPTLDAWALAADRPWTQIRDVCVQAGQGLAAAHHAGLVHRDYKPQNVIVGDDRARVGDFGLATGSAQLHASTHDDNVTTATLSQTGALVGTPAYMAPEQLRGERPGPAADQFAFCVATFEALTGFRPFAGSTVAQLQAAIEAAEIRIPDSNRAPRWLFAALHRGLRAAAADRFDAMDGLLDALQRDRRTRIGLRVAAAAGLVVSSSAAAYVMGATAPAGAVTDCTAAARQLQAVWNEARADALRGALLDARHSYGEPLAATVIEAVDTWAATWTSAREASCRLARDPTATPANTDAQISCLAAQQGELDAVVAAWIENPESSVDRLDEAIGELPDLTICEATALQAAPLPSDPALADAVAELREQGAAIRALLASGQFDSATTRAAAMLAAAQHTEFDPVVAEAWLVVATAARHRGELASAIEAAYESLWTAQSARHDRVAAQAWVALLTLAAVAGNFEQAPRLGRHSEAALARAGSPAPLQAQFHNTLGVAFENLGRYDEAESSLRRALAIREAQFGPQSTLAASVRTNLGNLARARGQIDEALRMHREALTIDERALGKAHPTIGRHLHNLARALLLSGQRDAALDHYQRALAIKQAAYGPVHVEVARTHNSLGLLFAAEGATEAATAAFESARSIYAELLHPEQALVALNLGRQHLAAGLPREALTEFDAAASAIEEHWGVRSRHYARVIIARADAELALGRRQDARNSYTLARGLAAGLPDAPLLQRASAGLAATRAPNLPKRPPWRAPPPATAPPADGAYAAGPALDDP